MFSFVYRVFLDIDFAIEQTDHSLAVSTSYRRKIIDLPHGVPDPTFDVVERRIRTLTSILQTMDRQRSSTGTTGTTDRKQVPSFLRHLATLFACDASDDPDSNRVIAVTGTLDAEELRTLIVVQNPSSSRNVSEFEIQKIAKQYVH